MGSDASRARIARRALRATLAAFAGLILLLMLAAGWLAGSENGARAVLSALAGASGGALQIGGVQGRLAGALSLDRLVLDRPDRRVALEQLRLDWEPLALLKAQLHIRSLHAGRISITNKIVRNPQPARMPESVALPLALQIDTVRIDGGDVGWEALKLLELGAFAFRLEFNGAQYSLQLDRFATRSTSENGTVTADVSGHATLGTAKPYALHAEFSGGSTATLKNRTIAAKGHVRLDGSLAELVADLGLDAERMRMQGHAALRPFSGQPVSKAELSAQAFDLAALQAGLPHTALDGDLSIAADGAGRLTISNRDAGLYNDGKLPLTDFHAAFRQAAGHFLFDRIAATLGNTRQHAGTVNGSGRYADGALTLALSVDGLDLQRLDRRLHATHLAGDIDAMQAAGKQQVTLALSEPFGKQRMAINAHASLADARLAIEHAELALGKGRLTASAHLDLADAQTFGAEGKVSRFRLQDIGQFTQLPDLYLNSAFSLRGAHQPQLNADLTFHIIDSRLAGRSLQGEGQAQLRADRILVPHFLLAAGDNRLDVHGELSQDASHASQLSFVLAAPRLEQLGPGFAGMLEASGDARGSFRQPRIHATWKGNAIHVPGRLQLDNVLGNADLTLAPGKPLLVSAAIVDLSMKELKSAKQNLGALSAHLQYAPQPDAPLSLDLRVDNISMPQIRADHFQASVQGTSARHAISATLLEPGHRQNWALHANGNLQQRGQSANWQGSIDRFDADGRFIAHLAAPAALAISPQRVQLDRFRLNANTAHIAVDAFVRDAHGITTRGYIEHLQLAQLLKFSGRQSAISTDLQLNGDWDVTLADAISGHIRMQRESGDIEAHGGAPVTLGLHDLNASVTAVNGRIDMRVNIEGRQLGHIDISARADTGGAQNRLHIGPDTPVSGAAAIDTPSLAWLGPLFSPTLLSEGRMQSKFSLGGTFAQPEFSGQIAATGLRFFFGELGLDLRQGALSGEFKGDTLLVKSLTFQSAGGELSASGPISFAGGRPGGQIALDATHYPLLNRSDRKLVLSGSSRFDLHEGKAKASGAFNIDSGYFDIGREDMPQLSDDVVVVGRNAKQSDRVAAAIDIDIDLGNAVVLKGHGLDGKLAGRVHLSSEPNAPLRAQGSVQVAQGTYTAYGRKLAIEQGALRFNGPLNNPALDILAMRRGQEVEAGVAVRGTVLAPRVTLVSEPAVPDAEKLSWLVLGRALSSAGTADIGALQSAAGTLLSQGAATGVQSQLATAFGLDELSIGTDQNQGLGQDKNNLQQRIVTVGKRLSSRLYVSYEQGLQTAGRVLNLRYTLSPRLTLEAEAGTRSALSLFFNVAFD